MTQRPYPLHFLNLVVVQHSRVHSLRHHCPHRGFNCRRSGGSDTLRLDDRPNFFRSVLLSCAKARSTNPKLNVPTSATPTSGCDQQTNIILLPAINRIAVKPSSALGSRQSQQTTNDQTMPLVLASDTMRRPGRRVQAMCYRSHRVRRRSRKHRIIALADHQRYVLSSVTIETR